jgi:hypothetical protein
MASVSEQIASLQNMQLLPLSFPVLTSGYSKRPPNFSHHRHSRTSMWMYSSDTPYSVQIFVQPMRFVFQFLITLFLIVLVLSFKHCYGQHIRFLPACVSFRKRSVRYVNTSLLHLHTTEHGTGTPAFITCAPQL